MLGDLLQIQIPFQPDPGLIQLVGLLAHDNEGAAEIYASIAAMCRDNGLPIEINALGCYLTERPRLRIRIREEKPVYELARYHDAFMPLILPKDLGILGRECLKKQKNRIEDMCLTASFGII